MSTNTEQRRMTAIIPRGGTDMVGQKPLKRLVLPRSNDLLSGKIRP
jgi:hypothetical protein